MRNCCKSEAVTGEDACLGCCKGFLPPSTWLTYWQSSTKESQTAKIWPLNSIHDIFVWHIVVVLLPSLAQLFATPWTAACQASPALTISRSFPQFNVTASVMPSSHLILWRSLLLLPSDGQNTGDSASASVLPTSTQGSFPLRLTGLISLLCKGLSGVFSSTTVERHQFFDVLLFFFPSSVLTTTGDHWKDPSLNYTDLCWQGDVSAF